MTDTYIVSIYLVDRAYGGPEEGGWYYTCFEPQTDQIRHLRVFQNQQEAIDYRLRLENTVIPGLNAGRYPMSSVLSDGEYCACIDVNELPAYFPKERPRYD